MTLRQSRHQAPAQHRACRRHNSKSQTAGKAGRPPTRHGGPAVDGEGHQGLVARLQPPLDHAQRCARGEGAVGVLQRKHVLPRVGGLVYVGVGLELVALGGGGEGGDSQG